jgi:hypothetical protein
LSHQPDATDQAVAFDNRKAALRLFLGGACDPIASVGDAIRVRKAVEQIACDVSVVGMQNQRVLVQCAQASNGYFVGQW